ncbi:uncharacterized protein LOC133173572 [Saccostrea echinata]|uniref:uncharacterized protein LOC133173572 n=1 Tax=Saccostrea echinata TaxID=191078 RepID=UPI002A82458F|nr:uncharacterized protein LOC133173572 [Saccostrea echinata]
MSFANSSVIGWELTAYGDHVSSWTCQDNANGLYLFKGDKILDTSSGYKNALICIDVKKLTPYSYQYYVRSDTDSNASNLRVYIETHNSSVMSWNTSDYCTPTSGPLVEEYHVIVRKGYESSVKQWCPIPLLGNFTYTHNDGTTTTCSGNSGLTVCPSWTTMEFDYSKCPTIQAFSSEGQVNCVHSTYGGSTFYTTVLSPGIVDDVNYYKFTCYAISSTGSSVYLSDSRGMCEAGQTSTVKQSDGSGTLTLTSTENCCE